MLCRTDIWTSTQGLPIFSSLLPDAQLVIYFGSKSKLANDEVFGTLRKICPDAILLGCSTGGEIFGPEVHDNSIVAASFRFDATPTRAAEVIIAEGGSSREAGEALGRKLADGGPKAIFVVSDGLRVNGSDLIAGLRNIVGDHVIITGGLAGDGPDFKETLVGLNQTPKPGRVAAVAFYGDAIRIGHGSVGGWDVFGPERRITKSKGNILFELDGQPVLPLYKRYLGDEAAKLPASALIFPLTVRPPEQPSSAIVRTILAVDEAAQSMTFAGDIPEGWTSQLMRGNFTRLVAGAEAAAEQARQGNASVAIMVSCIGRKLLLGQRIGDETEGVADILGPIPAIGFYSYGEISPHESTGRCELHNQTMTITTIGESLAGTDAPHA